MQFSPELRDPVASGHVTLSFRLWSRPKVKIGGQYAAGAVRIEVDSIEMVPFSSVTTADVRRAGERDRESLRQRAAHAGPIDDDTLVYRIEFHVVPSDTPWEPPLAGTEVEQLLGALDRLRTTFRWKADDLDAAGLQNRIASSSLTLGGLLKHLAAAEDYMFTTKLTGEPIGAPWDAMGWDGSGDWEFTFASADDDKPEQLYAFWDGAVERSRVRLDAVLADGGLDRPAYLSWPDGRHVSVRRLVCDLIEEYGRHTGHADLLREAVDGRVGEDPPRGWRPQSGPAGRLPLTLVPVTPSRERRVQESPNHVV